MDILYGTEQSNLLLQLKDFFFPSIVVFNLNVHRFPTNLIDDEHALGLLFYYSVTFFQAKKKNTDTLQ